MPAELLARHPLRGRRYHHSPVTGCSKEHINSLLHTKATRVGTCNSPLIATSPSEGWALGWVSNTYQSELGITFHEFRTGSSKTNEARHKWHQVSGIGSLSLKCLFLWQQLRAEKIEALPWSEFSCMWCPVVRKFAIFLWLQTGWKPISNSASGLGLLSLTTDLGDMDNLTLDVSLLQLSRGLGFLSRLGILPWHFLPWPEWAWKIPTNSSCAWE